MTKGYVHIYTGDGKGKTSAALGLALRAIGCGRKVYMVQFLKGGFRRSGERLRVIRGLRIECTGQVHPMFLCKTRAGSGEVKRLRRMVARDFRRAKNAAMERKFDILILDEVINAVSAKLLPEGELVKFIRMRPGGLELVLTGRGASKRLISMADYATSFRKVKHPFDRGVKARRGIEF